MKQVDILKNDVLPATVNILAPDKVAQVAAMPKPTPAEELLYKFVIVGATTITYMGQHERGKAYIDDLQHIFDGACRHLIARQKEGVDFSHLNPPSLQKGNGQ